MSEDTYDPRKTVEPKGASGGRRAGEASQVRHSEARLQVLFHSDLRRVGLVSAPGVFVGGGRVVVGRSAPRFIDPTRRHTSGRERVWTLADPCVSRRHVEVRWLDKAQAFELTPNLQTVLPVSVVVWSSGGRGGEEQALLEPLQGPRRVPPGTLVVLGERLMLRLEYGPVRGGADARLGMIGESEAMWALRERIETVARFRESVLVAGETGSGKEKVAEALHEAAESSGPLVALNMSRVNPNLADSELFGHVKGAFTSAHRDKTGAFERAKGGTLFLDEISDIPMEVQRKLLRVLESYSYTPLGSTKQLKLEARIVAATNASLHEAFLRGDFRYDLFERLRALQLSVPSLRQRREDVPLLFRHFLWQQTEAHPSLAWLWVDEVTADDPPIPLRFMLELMGRPWPGNVRELRNVVTATSAANLNVWAFTPPPRDEAFLEGLSRRPGASAVAPNPSHTPIAPSNYTPGSPWSAGGDVRSASGHGKAAYTPRSLPSLDDQTRAAAAAASPSVAATDGRPTRSQLAALLAEHKYNQTAVAQALRISRTTLVSWMEELGIPRAIDLTEDAIRAAWRQTGGDVEAAARLLEVSTRSLKLRIKSMTFEGGEGEG